MVHARLFALVLCLCTAGQVSAEVYQMPEAFVAEVFGTAPAQRVLWLSREVQAGAAAILGHPAANLRQRYWSDGAKSVWILEEIGKEELITAGFVVSQGRIDHARVLAYRESRGQEVRDPSFLKQFAGASLTNRDRLDRGIDGISGATLSVHAMERLARLALYFDRRSRDLMPFRLRLVRTLRRWHARIGFAALIFFVLIAVTGVVLNHGAAFGLDSRQVHSKWLARWYGIRQEQPRQAYRTASHLLVAANGRWLLDDSAVGEKMPHPLGLVEIGELIVVGGESSLHVYRADGALVDRLDGYALPRVPLKAIGAGEGELVVQTAAGPFSSADVLSWRPGAPKVVAWSTPTPLAASDREAYAQRLAPGISLQRVLLDLHSGRFLGRFGPLFFDLVAIFLTILALSGAWMFLAPRLRR